MKSLRAAFPAAMLMAMLLAAPGADAAGVHGKIAKASLETHVRPAYARLAGAAGRLQTAISALCETPSPAALAATETALRDAILAWGGVEHMRFGPVMKAHRYERLVFWPDRKSLGRRQVEQAVRERDADVLKVETLSEKSVAVQGLTALELLVFAKGRDALLQADGKGRFRCRYALAAAANVANIANAISAEWGDDGFARTLLDPGDKNALYLNDKEVTLELYKAFTGGIQQVRDLKLLRILGDTPDAARPKRAAFWRSKRAIALISADIASLRQFFRDGGFAGLVAQAQPGVETSLLLDLERAVKTLDALDGTVGDIVATEKGWKKLDFVRVVLGSVQTTAGGAIARAANLSLGFNAFDGD